MAQYSSYTMRGVTDCFDMTPTVPKFTFKIIQPTGKFRKGGEPTHIVKLRRARVGIITNTAPHKILLQVYKKAPSTLYMVNDEKNIRVEDLDKTFASIDEAKEWLVEHSDEITKKFLFKNQLK